MNAGVLQVHIPAGNVQINPDFWMEAYGGLGMDMTPRAVISIVVIITRIHISMMVRVHMELLTLTGTVVQMTTAVAVVEAHSVLNADMENSQLILQMHVLIVKLENIKTLWDKVDVKLVHLENIKNFKDKLNAIIVKLAKRLFRQREARNAELVDLLTQANLFVITLPRHHSNDDVMKRSLFHSKRVMKPESIHATYTNYL